MQTVKISNIAELKTRKGSTGAIVELLGYYTSGDEGGGKFYWDNNSTTTDDGGVNIQVTGVTTGRWIRIIEASVYNVKQFGVKGDFVSVDGSGTNDRVNIQKALDYVSSIDNATLVFPKGDYYGGNAIGAFTGGVHLLLNNANSVTIKGENATLYSGYEGRFFGIFNSIKVTIEGLKFVGYAGGTLSTNRERDALITINYNSENIVIDNCYITNSLGDCIYAGGSLVDGGLTGYQTKNLTIKNCTLKERIGNGVESYVSGTKSRLCIALVDVINASIHNNTFYGGVDLEPNLNNQHIINVKVINNTFLQGNVTAQAVVGSSYWYDEPVNESGGSIIEGVVSLTGSAGSPIIKGNILENNIFEYGLVYSQNVYSFDSISNNVFQKGTIEIGATSGSNYTDYISVKNNVAFEPRTGETTFIKLSGLVYFCNFISNIAYTFTNVIDVNGVSTGDGSRNAYIGNMLGNGTDVLSTGLISSLNANSVRSNNIKTGSTSRNFSEFGKIKTNEIFSPLVTITGATGSQIFPFATYGGNIWYVTIPTNTVGSITDITGETDPGQVLTILSGSAGSGNLTITYNSSLIRTATGTDLILTAGQSATFVNRAGIWFEIGNSNAALSKLNIASPAWTGNMTGTGNLSLTTAGNKLSIATGTNASIGTATLVAGTVTVATTAVTTSSLIFVTYNTPSGTLASGLSAPSGSIVNGTSFVINSLTTSGTVNTADVSTVRYWIIN